MFDNLLNYIDEEERGQKREEIIEAIVKYNLNDHVGNREFRSFQHVLNFFRNILNINLGKDYNLDGDAYFPHGRRRECGDDLRFFLTGTLFEVLIGKHIEDSISHYKTWKSISINTLEGLEKIAASRIPEYVRKLRNDEEGNWLEIVTEASNNGQNPVFLLRMLIDEEGDNVSVFNPGIRALFEELPSLLHIYSEAIGGLGLREGSFTLAALLNTYLKAYPISGGKSWGREEKKDYITEKLLQECINILESHLDREAYQEFSEYTRVFHWSYYWDRKREDEKYKYVNKILKKYNLS